MVNDLFLDLHVFILKDINILIDKYTPRFMKPSQDTLTTCYHCGDHCYEEIQFDDKAFCCHSCKTVYSIISEHELDSFYVLNPKSGLKNNQLTKKDEFIHYDDSAIRERVLHFQSENLAHLNLHIPEIHCSSCVWLLENIGKLISGILSSEINFLSKSMFISYNPNEVKLSEILYLLSTLGYSFRFKKDEKVEQNTKLNRHYIKLAVAGFAFGNVMLLSFPEYIDESFLSSEFRNYFPWVNLLFSLPVFLYAAIDYYKSAFLSLKQKRINIDVPITIGIFALFVKSIVDITLLGNFGYFDSFCGFIFFLLIGKTFQMKVYDHLSFENDFKSYFPLYVLKKSDTKWAPTLIENLAKDDRILVRSNEIIPVDSTLDSDSAILDYRFVTGESNDVKFTNQDFIYAGGKNIGSSIELTVKESVQRSYLINLWNKQDESEDVSATTNLTNQFSSIFTIIVLILASLTFVLSSLSISVFEGLDRMTAVLIVACPCALALSAPFTLGSYATLLSRIGFFFKNSASIEKLSTITSFVFDKTGTLSEQDMNLVEDHRIDKSDSASFYYLLKQSLHPLSQSVATFISCPIVDKVITDFHEIPGKGILAKINGEMFYAGSKEFLLEHDIDCPLIDDDTHSHVYLAKEKQYIGYFTIKHAYRSSLENALNYFDHDKTYLLSGDKRWNKKYIDHLFKPEHIHFEMNPDDKLDFIRGFEIERRPVCRNVRRWVERLCCT